MPSNYKDELAGPVAEDPPCGPDLDDLNGAIAALAAKGIIGRSVAIDHDAAKWGKLKSEVLGLCERSRDLRLLPYLGAAVLRSEDLESFLSVLETAFHWLKSYPEAVHPLVEPDFNERTLVLANFQDPFAIMEGLRSAPLKREGPAAAVTLQAWRVAHGEASAASASGAPALTSAQLQAALRAMGPSSQDLEAALVSAIQATEKIEALASGNEPGSAAGGLDELRRVLTEIRMMLSTVTGSEVGAVADAPASTKAGASYGPIRSRSDAIRALAEVQAFFEATEPSSPVPLLVDRAKRLINRNFLDVLEELMPDRVSEAKTVAGVRERA